MDLATQNVEQVGRAGHADDLHVAVLVLAVELVTLGEDTGLLIAKLQPTLHSTGGVLRTLTIVTVGQGNNKTRALQPLGLSSSDELINDTLSVVGKVTELSLPHDEGVGGGQGVTVLETKTRIELALIHMRKAEAETYAPNSLREELEITKLPWFSEMFWRGV